MYLQRILYSLNISEKMYTCLFPSQLLLFAGIIQARFLFVVLRYKLHVMGLSLKDISVSKRALQKLKHYSHTTTSAYK